MILKKVICELKLDSTLNFSENDGNIKHTD